jgi:two-component system, chemotaxis family, CheB/CheR fusion protein
VAANEQMRRRADEARTYRTQVQAMMRRIDAGVMVIDNELRVRSWNCWSENTWGVGEKEVTGQWLTGLNIGLPMRELDREVRQAVVEGIGNETELDAIDRWGRKLRCRVQVAPLLYEDHTSGGALVVVEERSKGP